MAVAGEGVGAACAGAGATAAAAGAGGKAASGAAAELAAASADRMGPVAPSPPGTGAAGAASGTRKLMTTMTLGGGKIKRSMTCTY